MWWILKREGRKFTIKGFCKDNDRGMMEEVKFNS